MIKVLFFSQTREAVGKNSIEITDIQTPCTVSQLRDLLLREYPALDRFSGALLYSINQEWAEDSDVINEGDEIGVLPPVSGG